MEHRQLQWGNITLGYDLELQSEYLEYQERQAKTRTGVDLNNITKQNPRIYAIGSDRCPVETYKTYADHRPTRFSSGDHPFYLSTITHQKFPEEEEQWFLRAPVGINKLKDLMKVMARNANLPALSSGERMTNTSVRKRLCQKLLQNNVPDTQAVLITGHKNANSSNYRVLSNLQQKNPSNLLSSRLVNEGLKKLNLLARSIFNRSLNLNLFPTKTLPS
ncbi:uncharacterized protein LOC128235685 [Mya arenaria]|uniref:uncharacterized protein LOC128235685 n=1 Tax=Mya arenaria TaxID=6604 RepID=UPI0022DEBAA6|nr:uncharacterized protein LOC128235685 [Mya arenaria]